jgi:uncharacterized alkaline shock family protein YloU
MSETEERESIGRIEVAPEVLTTIARHTTLKVDGVHKMAQPPADVGQLFRRAIRQDGVILDIADGLLSFDIFVFMDPHVNVLEASRDIQTAIMEAMNTMVGIAVEAINVHVEDVVYALDETA